MLDHDDLFPVFSSVVDAEEAHQPIYHLYMTMLFIPKHNLQTTHNNNVYIYSGTSELGGN